MRPPSIVGFRRQEIHFMLGGQAHHFWYVRQIVQVMEQSFQFSGWRDPEQSARRHVGLVEIAVWNSARQTNEVAGVRPQPNAVQLQVEGAFLHQDEFVLGGMNMDRHELSRLAVRLDRKSGGARRFRKIRWPETVER